MPTPPELRRAHLTITQSIAGSDGHGAQVVACDIKFQPKAPPLKAVAKIFDALYWNPFIPITEQPADVTEMADRAYGREAAAYENVRERKHKDFTAEYFGCWTFDQPITVENVEYQRPVRLVLMEYLEGATLQDLIQRTPPRYDEETRLRVFATILDSRVRLKHGGIEHTNFWPENIMVVPRQGQNVPRVVIIDFDRSKVLDKMSDPGRPWEKRAHPMNPLQVCWNSSYANFTGWIPESWLEDKTLRQKWLVKEFGGRIRRSITLALKWTPKSGV